MPRLTPVFFGRLSALDAALDLQALVGGYVKSHRLSDAGVLVSICRLF